MRTTISSLCQPELGQQCLDPRQNLRQNPLRFRQGQDRKSAAPGRPSRPGEWRETDSPSRRRAPGRILIDPSSLLRLHVHQKKILRRRQAHLRLELLNDFAQRGLELVAVHVFDPAVFDEQAEEIVAISLLVPAEQIPWLGEVERPRRAELEIRRACSSSLPEPLDAAFFDHIFEPRMFAVGPIAKIAMNRQHCFGRGFQLVRRDKTE